MRSYESTLMCMVTAEIQSSGLAADFHKCGLVTYRTLAPHSATSEEVQLALLLALSLAMNFGRDHTEQRGVLMMSAEQIVTQPDWLKFHLK